MPPLLMTSLPKGTHKEFQYVADAEAEARQGVVPTPPWGLSPEKTRKNMRHIRLQFKVSGSVA